MMVGGVNNVPNHVCAVLLEKDSQALMTRMVVRRSLMMVVRLRVLLPGHTSSSLHRLDELS